jgi:hypothetical protein
VGFDVTNQIFCIHQILEKKLEYNETVYLMFTDFTEKGSIALYSHTVWNTPEISLADENVFKLNI